MNRTLPTPSAIACGAAGLVIAAAVWFVSTGSERKADEEHPEIGIIEDSSRGTKLEAPVRNAQLAEAREAASQALQDDLVAEPASDPSFVPDEAGVTPADRVFYLLNSQRKFLRVLAEESSDSERTTAALNFMRRSIATIIRDRADFPPLEKKYISEEEPDPLFRFSCDGAWYEFSRGEFPEFDDVWDLSHLEEFPEEGWRVVENSAGELFRQALDKLNKETDR